MLFCVQHGSVHIVIIITQIRVQHAQPCYTCFRCCSLALSNIRISMIRLLWRLLQIICRHPLRSAANCLRSSRWLRLETPGSPLLSRSWFRVPTSDDLGRPLYPCCCGVKYPVMACCLLRWGVRRQSQCIFQHPHTCLLDGG